MWSRHPAVSATYPATLGGRFTWVIHLVCRGIGGYVDDFRLRPNAPRPAWHLPPSQIVGVAGYVGRVLTRFLALLARAEAGTLRPPRPRPAEPPPEPPANTSADPPPKRERPRLPREFGWLLRRLPPAPMVSNPLAIAREGLEILMADPEMAALLATAPQTGRVLRPLCHALGIRPLPEALRRLPRPPDPAREAARAEARAARAQARSEACAEAAWGRAYRRSLGLPARAPRDILASPVKARPPPKRG